MYGHRRLFPASNLDPHQILFRRLSHCLGSGWDTIVVIVELIEDNHKNVSILSNVKRGGARSGFLDKVVPVTQSPMNQMT